jgi:hypothetical protein
VKRNTLKPRLDILEALLQPKGKLIVLSTPAEAARINAGPRDIVVITGVPRPAERVSA